MMRILIADDHPIVRKGLRQILLEEHPAAQIEEAGDSEELIEKMMEGRWDIVICDLNMPGRCGLDALKQIKQISPTLPVLVISMYPVEQYGLIVLRAGASGYLGKDSFHDELKRAINTVVQGKKFITQSMAEKLAEALHQNDLKASHELLSDREFDIFKLLASDITISEIAAQLSLSASTVSTYRSRILEKLHLRSTADLTRYAFEKNLI